MKKFIIFLLLANVAFAATIEVKRANIMVEIDKNLTTLSKNDKINLATGKTICIVGGKGKLIINNKIKISMKSRNKCYTNADSQSVYTESFANKAKVFLDGEEESVAGMTRSSKVKDDQNSSH